MIDRQFTGWTEELLMLWPEGIEVMPQWYNLYEVPEEMWMLYLTTLEFKNSMQNLNEN